MKVTIFGGTGSIGAYFAYRLASFKHNVTIIGRESSENLKQIEEVGLTIKFYNETVFAPSSMFTYVGGYNATTLNSTQDFIIVSLKQPNFDFNIAQQIKSLTDNNSIIGVISNGLPFYFLSNFNLGGKDCIESVDAEGKIHQLMQDRKIITIMPLMGSNIESPGAIKVVNIPERIKTFIGGDVKVSELVSDVLNKALIPNNVSENISKLMLEKLQFALAINVMSALLNKFNGQVFQSEENQDYVRYVIVFVDHLAKALGIEKLRDYQAFKALNISEARYSSMHEDFVKGRTPEIKVIVSSPLELAHHFNISISTKPIELVESLLLAKVDNIMPSIEKIQEIYDESKLALDARGIEINMLGEVLE